jgi:hypothetical protein
MAPPEPETMAPMVAIASLICDDSFTYWNVPSTVPAFVMSISSLHTASDALHKQ